MSRSIASCAAVVGPQERLLSRSYTALRGATTALALPLPWMSRATRQHGRARPARGWGGSLRRPGRADAGTMAAGTPGGLAGSPGAPPPPRAPKDLALSAGTLSPVISAAPQQVLGACPHDCPDTCSLVTTVENGVATKVQGNPAHRPTAGVLCAKVSRYTERTYHADRLL